MKGLQKLLISILCIGVLFGGCKEYKTIKERATENAIVSELEHKEKNTKREYGYDIYKGKYRSRYVTHPAEYNISFDGKVDFDVNDKEIFERFSSVGDEAIVEYDEIVQIELEDTNKDGEKEIVESKFLRYKFVDAYPVTE